MFTDQQVGCGARMKLVINMAGHQDVSKGRACSNGSRKCCTVAGDGDQHGCPF